MWFMPAVSHRASRPRQPFHNLVEQEIWSGAYRCPRVMATSQKVRTSLLWAYGFFAQGGQAGDKPPAVVRPVVAGADRRSRDDRTSVGGFRVGSQ
jgi:hypothetical protein